MRTFGKHLIWLGLWMCCLTSAAHATCSILDLIADRATGNYVFPVNGTNTTLRVDNDGTSSWLLVGRGREGWEFDANGQGNAADVIQNLGVVAGFPPAAYSDTFINAILAQSTGRDLTDVEIRIKRAANIAGTQYQEVRWRSLTQTTWTWSFNVPNTNNRSGGYGIDHDVGASVLGGAANFTARNTSDTWNFGGGTGTGNNYQRIWTFAWSGKGSVRGFNYGSTVQGVNNNDPNTFLWERTTERHATPYTEVYIRLLSPEGCIDITKTPSVTSVSSAGTTINYSIAISNPSVFNATGITVTDPLAPVTCPTSSSNTIALLTANGGSETCTASYTTTTADFDTNGGGDGDIDNTVTVAGTSNGTAFSVDAEASVSLTLNPSLTVTKTADETIDVELGEEITYTYVVTNNGNQTISNIDLSEVHNGSGPVPSPAGETLTTDTAPTGDSSDSPSNNGIWTSLAPGDTVTFTGTYTVTVSDIENLQ